MDIRYKCSQSSQCAWVKVIGGRCSATRCGESTRQTCESGGENGTAVGLEVAGGCCWRSCCESVLFVDVHFLSISTSNHLNPDLLRQSSVVVDERQHMPNASPYLFGGWQDLILRQLEPPPSPPSRSQLNCVGIFGPENLKRIVHAVSRRRIQHFTSRAGRVLGAVDLSHGVGEFPAKPGGGGKGRQCSVA